MQATQKFMFDRDFDDLEILREIVEQEVDEIEQVKAESSEPVTPVAPTFSEDDLAAARQAAYEKGKHDGRAEALSGIEQKISQSLDRVAGEIEGLFATQIRDNEATARDAAHLAMAVARKLFPHLHARHGLGEIVRVTEDIISHLICEPRLMIAVHEAHVEAMRERIEDFLQKRGFSGQLEIRGDSSIGPGDCRIEWMGGDAARDTSALFDEIETVVERHVGRVSSPEPTQS